MLTCELLAVLHGLDGIIQRLAASHAYTGNHTQCSAAWEHLSHKERHYRTGAVCQFCFKRIPKPRIGGKLCLCVFLERLTQLETLPITRVHDGLLELVQ
ncbi:MAG TPA: hypothetical protein VMX97_00860 [Hyphomicrobiaceae bacterium]|nr:hypothetical protein [Hyphomicrobiaceae bacterium]